MLDGARSKDFRGLLKFWLISAMAWSLPAVSLYSVNAAEFPPRALFGMLTLIAPFAFAVAALFQSVQSWSERGVTPSRRDPFAALATAVLGLATFAYSGAVLNGAPRRLAAPIALACAFCVLRRLWRHRGRDFTPDQAVITAVVSAALALPIASIVHFAFMEASPQWLSGGRRAEDSRVSVQPVSARTPHIIHIVLDSYGRSDILASHYSHNNSIFQAALEKRGFSIAHKARSNYAHTAHSLASMLNGEHLNSLAESLPYGSRDLAPLRHVLQEGKVISALRGKGYRIVSLDSGAWVTSFPSTSLRAPAGGTDDELRLTLVGLFLPSRSGAKRHRYRVQDALARIPRIAASSKATYLLAHLLCPHPPFVFQQDGTVSPGAFFGTDSANRLIRPGRLDRSAYVAAYSKQASYIESAVISTIDEVLTTSPVEPIILIHGDHGEGAFYHHENPLAYHLLDRYSILFAIRIPGRRLSIRQDLSLVNAFRETLPEVLNDMGTSRPDTPYSAAVDNPYLLTDVSEEVGSNQDMARWHRLKDEPYYP